MGLNPGIYSALAAALLFGASTPLAKLLVGEVSPLLLAGLLYLASGIGLGVWTLVRLYSERRTPLGLGRGDWFWLAAAVLVGGMLGPVLLLYGLSLIAAADAALLLNLEGVFTALLAWFVFRENYDRRVVVGMALIVLGSLLLAWHGGGWGSGVLGALLVASACLAWAVDNNLTRKVSGGDAVAIAAVKGAAAGAFNLTLALLMGQSLPTPSLVLGASLVGLGGYGVSLALFVVALRHLGTARTSAYFSLAPFAGALVALALLQEDLGLLFWPAFLLMAGGVWLHLSERHEHLHVHEPIEHSHPHVHDEHHQHEHDFEWSGEGSHTHLHSHPLFIHAHPHYPDIHHRHSH